MSIHHRLLLIKTGGTIEGYAGNDESEISGGRTPDEFKALMEPTASYLKESYSIDLDIEIEELCALDSSDIAPEHWSMLAQLIYNKYDMYHSFVITHGTNTLGYTSAALSFSLANPDKPIILTGSQVPTGMPGSDAMSNLQNAFRVAVWPRIKNPIKGIMAVFGGHIIPGTRVKKETEFDYDAFRTFNEQSIGRIGRVIEINEKALEKHLSYLRARALPPARDRKGLRCEKDFDMRILSLTEFPGMDFNIIKTLVLRDGIKGVILRSFGAGDPCTNNLTLFKWLKDKEIPIVVTTQTPNGLANLQINEPGSNLLRNGLAIPAHDMSIESQTTKLAWLLAKKEKSGMTYEQVCEKMVEDLRGEISVKWEAGK